MTDITAAMVKTLREMTGAGFNDCRTALQETGGDMDKAADYLRKKGIATAAKKAGRSAEDGIIQTYMHHNGRLGVLVEVNSETDFVARNDSFKAFAKELALHIANLAPRYITREEIPAELAAKEREVLLARTIEEGKPANVAEKIVEGRMAKWYEELALMDQVWLHDDNKKVKEVLTDLIAEIKENIVIRRFARFALGEEESNGA
ncbi:MAG TPA: translation elongation factor Ts [Aggregatilineales bacterium]|nr:translation elongation factor Ts [Aggregatilineales bacterium]